MKLIMTAIALAIAAPAAAQNAADPHAGHAGHADHPGTKPADKASGCCDKMAAGQGKDCCDKTKDAAPSEAHAHDH